MNAPPIKNYLLVLYGTRLATTNNRKWHICALPNMPLLNPFLFLLFTIAVTNFWLHIYIYLWYHDFWSKFELQKTAQEG